MRKTTTRIAASALERVNVSLTRLLSDTILDGTDRRSGKSQLGFTKSFFTRNIEPSRKRFSPGALI